MLQSPSKFDNEYTTIYLHRKTVSTDHLHKLLIWEVDKKIVVILIIIRNSLVEKHVKGNRLLVSTMNNNQQ